MHWYRPTCKPLPSGSIVRVCVGKEQPSQQIVTSITADLMLLLLLFLLMLRV
jgi:hypothetical protein